MNWSRSRRCWSALEISQPSSEPRRTSKRHAPCGWRRRLEDRWGVDHGWQRSRRGPAACWPLGNRGGREREIGYCHRNGHRNGCLVGKVGVRDLMQKLLPLYSVIFLLPSCSYGSNSAAYSAAGSLKTFESLDKDKNGYISRSEWDS